MRSLTINLVLAGSKALILGCGAVGLRKLERLLETGAEITVVEPRPGIELRRLRDERRIGLRASFAPELLEGTRLVFAATGEGVPGEVLEAAREGRILLNAADAPGLGSFTLPAVAEEGDLRIAVSTGGQSPALAAALAARFREEFSGWGGYVALMGALRALVLESQLPQKGRAGILRRLAGDRELARLVREGSEAEALAAAGRLMAPLELPPGFRLPVAAAGGGWRPAPGSFAVDAGPAGRRGNVAFSGSGPLPVSAFAAGASGPAAPSGSAVPAGGESD
ncbi:MAG: bifunctional precorrin-2 dehydrogenase/sirohydrochlorin ferrochelatase [Deltaproteobacteria bacterium]|nr:bifunctional precorrin-2 dehydrogenase/sirohydrochlorin ferrochelatase [Deltaproteobacteria bacterium]